MFAEPSCRRSLSPPAAYAASDARVEVPRLVARPNPPLRPVMLSPTPAHGGKPQMRTHFLDSATRAVENEEQPSTSPTFGARTRAGAPCERAPEPGRRRCRLHGGAAGTGAPRGNTNARRHGLHSARHGRFEPWLASSSAPGNSSRRRWR